MTRFRSLLRKSQVHDSVQWHDSQLYPGVQFAVRRISLGQRIELAKKARELAHQYEFMGTGNAADHWGAVLTDLLVRRMYLLWGLVAVRGLNVNGVPAEAESLADFGPEQLADEVIEILRNDLGLTENERKNS